ncbi:MAG: DUF4491 family protein [Muribaculaceae bacterium]|nr:DUF4491 family protein [Muribaculaceae bacterium]
MSFLTQFTEQTGLYLDGVIVGLCTFLIIGLFHPLVIKGEYYFGKKCRVWFLIAGIIFMAAAVFVADVMWSSLLGVIAFSSFWSIKEINEQAERVRKGWFPRNPKRTYPEDTESKG